MTAERPDMSAHVRAVELSPAQLRAVLALVGSGSVSEAASAASVTERSVRRWLASDGFRRVYREVSRAAAAGALSALLSAQTAAVAALRDALTAESPATRVRAARVLLEVGARALDDDVDQRPAACGSRCRPRSRPSGPAGPAAVHPSGRCTREPLRFGWLCQLEVAPL